MSPRQIRVAKRPEADAKLQRPFTQNQQLFYAALRKIGSRALGLRPSLEGRQIDHVPARHFNRPGRLP